MRYRSGLLVLWLVGGATVAGGAEELPALAEIRVPNRADGTMQPSLMWAPEAAQRQPTPLLVFLHSWSGNYRQKNDAWRREAAVRGWIYLHPDFRGENDTPAACGSPLARQDILDAIDFVSARYKVDPSRIYLAGVSGGGHMAMLMAARHPERFSAVSAWVGISDLAAWYRFHCKEDQPQRYARMLLGCCGGPPGASAAVDAEYRARSPLFHLAGAKELPLDLNAGVNDGHEGSVPVSQTLRAFNAVAAAGGHPTITEAEIEQLVTQRRLAQPRATDGGTDAAYGRELRLRRTAGAARVTIFEGGHEGLAPAAAAWLATQQRMTAERVE